ncbi:MAG: hypothetical protein ACLFUB_16805 [Cyclobacteriaceae bacterium]
MNKLRQISAMIALFALSAVMISCEDEDVDINNDGRADEAILIAERFNTPDGRVAYMGVFEELPTAPIEVSQLTELSGEGKVFGCGGNAFQYDPATGAITKYIVEDDLSLTKAESIQVTQEGIEGFSAAIVCASPTKAYIFNSNATRGVEFNPEEMVITDAFDLPAADIEPDLDLGIFEPYVSGDLVYFPAEVVNWNTIEYSTKAVVGVFDMTDKSWSYTYKEDNTSGNAGYVTADGTFYQEGYWSSFFITYSDQTTSATNGILRIPAGGKAFDSGFKTELNDVQYCFPIDDQFSLILQIDPSAEIPSKDNLWDWWSLPVVANRINKTTGEISAYSGIPNRAPMNSRILTLDGKALYQVNEFTEDGLISKTDVVELTPQGATSPIFTLMGGDVLAIERLK